MPKMPKGMFKRGSSFYVRRKVAGKDRWMSLGPDFAVACRALLRLRIGESVRPRQQGDEVRVSDAATGWLESYIATARAPKQQRLTASRVRLYLLPALGGRLLRDVTPDDLRKYRLGLERLELSPQTVSHVLSDARCLFAWAEESGILSKSPVPRKLLPGLQERVPDRLTDEEVEVLVGLPEPFGFVVRLGLATGLRWAELCRCQSRHAENGWLVVSQTKSGKVRRVPLGGELASEISTHVGRLVPFREADPGTFSWHVRRMSGSSGFTRT